MGRWLVEHEAAVAFAPVASGMMPAAAAALGTSSGSSMGMGISPAAPPMHMMMMQMTFELTNHVTLWFSAWHIRGPWLYAASCVGLFLLCILQEALTSYRAHFALSETSQAAGFRDEGWQHPAHHQAGMNGFDGITGGISTIGEEAAFTKRTARWTCSKLLLSLLYGSNLTMAYLLMLAIMTYNIGYFLVIVVGLTTGHFCFFRWHQSSSDVCHAQPAEV